jgi:hypothetical protein
MSLSKSDSIITGFTLSSSSVSLDDSALLSNLDPKLKNSQNNLLSEISLINEDRLRLQQQNTNLLQTLSIKSLQIELLSKVATKALSENYSLKITKKEYEPSTTLLIPKLNSPFQGLFHTSPKHSTSNLSPYLLSSPSSRVHLDPSKIVSCRTALHKYL